MTSKLHTLLKKVGQSWIALCVFLLFLLVVARGTPLWAASIREINQTVPPPTQTDTPTPVPPATATPYFPSPDSGGGQQPQSPNTPGQASSTDKKLTGTVKSKTLNIRSGPGTGFLVIGLLKQGDQIEIIEQNPKKDWWHICCLPGSDVRGWVNASFVTPNFDSADAQKLIPVAAEIPAIPTPTTTPTSVPTSTALTSTATLSESTKVVGDSPAGTAIAVDFVQSPAFPVQGMTLTMQISVTNPTNTKALDVEFRDELPKGLGIVDIVTADAAIVQQDMTENLREVFSILWPILATGETVTATVHLRIDPALPDGTVLDNLVFAGGSNVPGSTDGISIGMPPITLPDFQ